MSVIPLRAGLPAVACMCGDPAATDHRGWGLVHSAVGCGPVEAWAAYVGWRP